MAQCIIWFSGCGYWKWLKGREFWSFIGYFWFAIFNGQKNKKDAENGTVGT
jgi:hypothetical protein